MANDRKILIIGKNGFVGKSLCEYFLGKHDVCLEAVGHRELDLLDEYAVDSFFSDKYYDVVIDAAIWVPVKNDASLRDGEAESDIRMFLHLERNKEKYGRLIYFGSGAEFDKTRDIIGVDEEDGSFPLPKSHYGFAKYVINQLICHSGNIYNLRIFGLYGKYEDYRHKFITGACAKASLGLPISIRQNVYFDYLYIDDFCEMVDRFIRLEQPMFHAYNITSGRKIDLVTIAKIVRETSGKELDIFVCKEGLAKEYTASNKRLMREIGEMDFTPHAEAIHALYGYFEENKESLDLMGLLYQD